MAGLSEKLRREIILACCCAPVLITIVPGVAQAAPAAAATPATQPAELTNAQIETLIDDAGKTPPPWWDSTPLNVPAGMDMTWGKPAPGQPPSHYIGSYIIEDIYPNPDRWREGVKLCQQSLVQNKNNSTVNFSASFTLTRLYADMLQDYPRGAFWARKCGSPCSITLAQCYLKMGSKQMAVDLLTQLSKSSTHDPSVIKGLAEAGELDQALALVDADAKVYPTQTYQTAGEACRLAGNIPQAIDFFQKAIAVNHQDVFKNRAMAALEAIKLYDSLDLTKISDGTYKSSSLGYSGPVDISIDVKKHQIVSVKVTQHHEKRFYASIVDTCAQIVQKQSVKGIDTTTGATVTSEAIINASAKALAAAHK